MARTYRLRPVRTSTAVAAEGMHPPRLLLAEALGGGKIQEAKRGSNKAGKQPLTPSPMETLLQKTAPVVRKDQVGNQLSARQMTGRGINQRWTG